MKIVILMFSLVILANLALAEVASHEASQSRLINQNDTQAWWTNRTSGLIGTVFGSAVGLTGAVIGTLAGIGIARKLCLFLLCMLFVFGVASLALGVIALTFTQPYIVYYPLLLLGFICVVVPSILFFVIRRQYEQRELRKMQAMDTK